MRIRFILCLIVATFTATIHAQNLTVPDSILNDLQSIRVSSDPILKDSIFFKVVYPDNYDSTKTYPVLLGLSGGNQNEKIVNYCYAAWFKSNYFKNYMTILPVNENDKNLLHYSPDDIQKMFVTIKKNFNVTPENWIIVGTSNGGGATFKFISREPTLFQGGIVVPGILEDSVVVNNSWNELKFIIAYGDQESKDWIKASKKTKKKLSKFVKSVEAIELKGQGHILPIDFDIDIVYKKYFEED